MENGELITTPPGIFNPLEVKKLKETDRCPIENCFCTSGQRFPPADVVPKYGLPKKEKSKAQGITPVDTSNTHSTSNEQPAMDTEIFGTEMNSYWHPLPAPAASHKIDGSKCDVEVDSCILQRRERNRERMRRLRSNPDYVAKERERMRQRKRSSNLLKMQQGTLEEIIERPVGNSNVEDAINNKNCIGQVQPNVRSRNKYTTERGSNGEYRHHRKKLKLHLLSNNGEMDSAMIGKILECGMETVMDKTLVPDIKDERSLLTISNQFSSQNLMESLAERKQRTRFCNTYPARNSDIEHNQGFGKPYLIPAKNSTNTNSIDEAFLIQMIRREKNKEAMRRRRSDPEYRKREKERRQVLAQQRRQFKFYQLT